MYTWERIKMNIIRKLVPEVFLGFIAHARMKTEKNVFQEQEKVQVRTTRSKHKLPIRGNWENKYVAWFQKKMRPRWSESSSSYFETFRTITGRVLNAYWKLQNTEKPRHYNPRAWSAPTSRPFSYEYFLEVSEYPKLASSSRGESYNVLPVAHPRSNPKGKTIQRV